MTKSTITREQVFALIAEHSYDSALVDALEHLLATMEAEPVAWIVQNKNTGYVEIDEPFAKATNPKYWTDSFPVYRHAQQSVVPDDVLAALQKVARIRLDMNDFDGDRRGIADCLCDAEEALIEVVNRRAAMFNHPEQHLDMVDHSGDVNEKGGDGNSPVIPDGWTCNDKANAALMMLDRIETVDPVDDDRIDGIKRIVRELAAATQSPGSDPATVPGKWIPVSERMPIEFEAVIAFDGDQVYGEAMHSSDDGFTIDGYDPCDRVQLQNVTHWMPLPSAPQEVKGE
ncbi:Eaa1 [Klebsiella pneumoniae]|nr:DUF551 domain-containing protein [Klebsiella pneumoniae]SVR95253.1 Eaa1 [Klebsiella pneumoniae]